MQKSRIRETPNLSTDADNSTNICFPLAPTKGQTAFCFPSPPSPSLPAAAVAAAATNAAAAAKQLFSKKNFLGSETN